MTQPHTNAEAPTAEPGAKWRADFHKRAKDEAALTLITLGASQDEAEEYGRQIAAYLRNHGP